MSALKQVVTIGGHQIAYQTAGNPANPPLVMIHGWLSHRGVWRQTFDALQSRYYCVALDVLGLGDSDKPSDGDYSIAAQAKRVLALADHLGLGRFTLIGHSMGGQIALYLASILAPERVERLVNIAGVSSGRLHFNARVVTMDRMRLALQARWMWELTRALVLRYPAVARFEFRTWFYDIQAIPYDSWALDRDKATQPSMQVSAYRCGQAIQAADLTMHLPRIQAPTLVIFGKQDAVVPVDEGRLVERLAPNSRLTLIDACGHFPMYEQTETYLNTLRAFLDEAAPRAA